MMRSTRDQEEATCMDKDDYISMLSFVATKEDRSSGEEELLVTGKLTLTKTMLRTTDKSQTGPKFRKKNEKSDSGRRNNSNNKCTLFMKFFIHSSGSLI